MKKTTLAALTLCLLTALPVVAQRTQRLFIDRNMRTWTPYLRLASQESKYEFSIRKSLIRLSGQYGYIRTDKQYENYELSVEWRWPEEASNSGIFLHVQDEFKIWPENFECQLWAGNAGDIYPAGGISCAESRENPDLTVIQKQSPSNEKPVGEWNHARIICLGDTITVYINGEFQNRVTGLSKKIGSIGLQSEGKPVEFRNVTIRSLMSVSQIKAKEAAEAKVEKEMMKKEMEKTKLQQQQAREAAEIQLANKRKNEKESRAQQKEYRKSRRSEK